MKRREFIRAGVAIATGIGLLDGGEKMVQARSLPQASWERLPRWRGFNLLEMFQLGKLPPGPDPSRYFRESDFQWIHNWGFDFVRLPMDYRIWTDPTDWTKIQEDALAPVDQAIEMGKKYKIHVCLNFHRAPGYTVAQPPEQRSLWTDPEAQAVCAQHWAFFAHRYRGYSNKQLSFDLLNEPPHLDPDLYRNTVELLLLAIRKEDPSRLIICDGRDWGNTPPTELEGLKVACSTRGYQPFMLTHYHAEWVHGSMQWPLPTYPLREGNVIWDRSLLKQRQIDPWKKLEQQGVGVMVGEFGAYNKTPSEVVRAWMTDCLGLWQDAGWGWALWNFRGSFGILDSGRSDVVYEDWQGHKLDRKMLELLQAH